MSDSKRSAVGETSASFFKSHEEINTQLLYLKDAKIVFYFCKNQMEADSKEKELKEGGFLITVFSSKLHVEDMMSFKTTLVDNNITTKLIKEKNKSLPNCFEIIWEKNISELPTIIKQNMMKMIAIEEAEEKKKDDMDYQIKKIFENTVDENLTKIKVIYDYITSNKLSLDNQIVTTFNVMIYFYCIADEVSKLKDKKTIEVFLKDKFKTLKAGPSGSMDVQAGIFGYDFKDYNSEEKIKNQLQLAVTVMVSILNKIITLDVDKKDEALKAFIEGTQAGLNSPKAYARTLEDICNSDWMLFVTSDSNEIPKTLTATTKFP